MDEEQIVSLGAFCERLLGDGDFNTVTQMFEAQTLQNLLGTKRADKDAREELYATIQSVRDYLNFMLQLAAKSRELTEPKPPVDTTDDPRVHDIFAEDEE